MNKAILVGAAIAALAITITSVKADVNRLYVDRCKDDVKTCDAGIDYYHRTYARGGVEDGDWCTASFYVSMMMVEIGKSFPTRDYQIAEYRNSKGLLMKVATSPRCGKNTQGEARYFAGKLQEEIDRH